MTSLAAPAAEFPHYTVAERAVDAAVHLLGLAVGIIGVAWLFAQTGPAAAVRRVTLGVYAAGLFGMLTASTLYNLAAAGRMKAVLRKMDHAMIFVMIAGSYTPFTVCALRREVGIPLCVAVWSLAVFGVGLCMMRRRIDKRISMALYLGMGWLALPALPALAAAVSPTVLMLLFGGGVVYSVGSWVHARLRVPFHNAAWHGMVVVAAALHLAAVAQLRG